MCDRQKINPIEFISAITAIAAAISKSCTSDEIALWGAAFTQLGDTLVTIAAVQDVNSNNLNDPKKSDTSQKA